MRGAVLDLETDRAEARCKAAAETLELGGLTRAPHLSRAILDGEDGLRKVRKLLRVRGLAASWAYYETNWQPQGGKVAAVTELWMDWLSAFVLRAMDGMTEIPGAGAGTHQRVAHALEMALPTFTTEDVAAARALVALHSGERDFESDVRKVLAEWMLARNTWDRRYIDQRRFVARKKRRPARAIP